MPSRREHIGQTTSIANEIRRNLSNYHDGQIIAELLQNCDDAGAKRAGFMLDMRNHDGRTVYMSDQPTSPPGRMAELQGPALVAFDDAVFKPADWQGLLSFGQVGFPKRAPKEQPEF